MRIIAFCLLVCSCQTAPITHVVICWLKSPGDETGRQKVIDATEELKKIPGVVSVTAGRAIPPAGQGFDVGIVVTFKDEAALRAYESNPIHVKARDEVLRPLAGKVIVYDLKK